MHRTEKLIITVMLSVSALNAVATNTSGLAPKHFYVRLDMGAAGLKDQTITNETPTSTSESDATFDPVFQGQLGVGYIFSPLVRVDLTGTQTGHMNFKTDESGKGDLSSGQLSLNGYFDFGRLWASQKWFNPYVGAGFGYAYNKVGKISTEADGQYVGSLDGHSQHSLAWRAMAGIGFAVSPHFTVDVSHTYTDAGTLETGSTVTLADDSSFDLLKPSKIEMQFQQAMLGVRYRF